MYTYRSPVPAGCILQHLASRRGPATADVRLQCGDGAVGGHLLVLAAIAISPLLRAVFGEDSWDEDIVIMLPDLSVNQINKYFSDIYHSKDLEDHHEINIMLGHMKPEDARARGKHKIGFEQKSVKHEDSDEEEAFVDVMLDELESSVREKQKQKMKNVSTMWEEIRLQRILMNDQIPEVSLDSVKFEGEDFDDEDLQMVTQCDKGSNSIEAKLESLKSETEDFDDELENPDRKTHLDESKYVCPNCGLRTIAQALPKHVRKCNGCNLCGFKTNNRADFLSHVETAHEGKRFQCSYCNLQTTKEGNLRRHIREVHEGGSICPHCDFKAKRISIINEHIRVVHEGKPSTPKKPAQSPCLQPHLCPQCGHKASTKGNLQIHIRVKHEGIRYPCPQCDYQATTRGSLRTHISSVHDPQKHLCPHCGFAANSKKGQENHIKAVHEEHKFLCALCDYKAARKVALEQHVRIVHEGLNFPCPQCDYKATREHNLKIHIKTVHEGLRFKCPHCDYQVTRQDYLQKHISSIHTHILQLQ